jgi:hypothetical protein
MDSIAAHRETFDPNVAFFRGLTMLQILNFEPLFRAKNFKSYIKIFL